MVALRMTQDATIQKVALVDDESDEANADSILNGMSKCVSELRGNIPPSRKPHRTLLRVVHVTSESNEKVIDVIIPGMRLPMV